LLNHSEERSKIKKETAAKEEQDFLLIWWCSIPQKFKIPLHIQVRTATGTRVTQSSALRIANQRFAVQVTQSSALRIANQRFAVQVTQSSALRVQNKIH
jgi:hypothetical protein